MQKKLQVAILVPCRNEVDYIAELLDSIIANDFSKDNMQVLVLDGMSVDGTRDIVLKYIKAHPFIRLIDNPARTVPHAMNLGIKTADAEYIVRMDVHASYPTDYISKLIDYMERLGADNVGGRWDTVAASNRPAAVAIALVLSHPFGVGNASYRVDRTSTGYAEVDTVPFGCYRKEIFSKVGLYDEDLIRNQDNELNARLKKAGGKIYLIQSIVIKYYARQSYTKLWRMLYQYAYFGPLVDLKVGHPVAFRKYVPALFVLSVLLPPLGAPLFGWLPYVSLSAVTAHVLANGIVSLQLAMKNGVRLYPYLMFGFAVSHIAYGIGYLRGTVDFVLIRKHQKGPITVTTSR